MRFARVMRPWTRYAVVAAVLLGLAVSPGAGAARADEPGQAPPVVSFRGNSDGRQSVIAGTVSLHAGLVVLRARANSSSIFTVDLATAPAGLSPLTDYTFSRNLINNGLRYDGAVATLLPTDNEYFVIVSVSGTFSLTLEQPDLGNAAPVNARTFTGEADGVTPVFALPAGTYTIHVTSAATSRLFAWLYQVDDLGGSTVFDSSDGRFLQQLGGPFDETATFTIRRPGRFLLFINAGSYEPVKDAPTWSISVE